MVARQLIIGGRKVRAPEDSAVANGDFSLRLKGKCHRKYTAPTPSFEKALELKLKVNFGIIA